MAERTIVGVPFYEKEGQECLDFALTNIDNCLGKLAIDASVIIQINGPQTSVGEKPNLYFEKSKYNSDIELCTSTLLGQVASINAILETASRRNIERTFISDADIFRFSDSLKEMWHYDDATLVGARYRPYPIEMVEAEFGYLTEDERLLYQIFDGDQTPQARQAMEACGVERKPRVKGSLMLLKTEKGKGVHKNQNLASDSVINRYVGTDNSVIAEKALFMHMGRTDMTDHIKARLRHFRAAKLLGEIDSFLHHEISLPPEEDINKISDYIRQNYIRGDFYAMLYLCRCAIRERVNNICLDIVNNNYNTRTVAAERYSLMNIRNYNHAKVAVEYFFNDVDWNDILGFSINPPTVTQEKLRRPFDATKHLADFSIAKAAITAFELNNRK